VISPIVWRDDFTDFGGDSTDGVVASGDCIGRKDREFMGVGYFASPFVILGDSEISGTGCLQFV
jgi:hypothetical protein